MNERPATIGLFQWLAGTGDSSLGAEHSSFGYNLRMPSAVICSWNGDPLLRHGWQHDGRDPLNPEQPGVMPQKVPAG